jgi:hypothetical protein
MRAGEGVGEMDGETDETIVDAIANIAIDAVGCVGFDATRLTSETEATTIDAMRSRRETGGRRVGEWEGAMATSRGGGTTATSGGGRWRGRCRRGQEGGGNGYVSRRRHEHPSDAWEVEEDDADVDIASDDSLFSVRRLGPPPSSSDDVSALPRSVAIVVVVPNDGGNGRRRRWRRRRNDERKEEEMEEEEYDDDNQHYWVEQGG